MPSNNLWKNHSLPVAAASCRLRILEQIARTPIDVALVDIRLPKMDGDSLILQAHRLNPQMRFLIHTGSVEYKLPDELKTAGVGQEHIFLKPQMDLLVFKDAICKLMSADS